MIAVGADRQDPQFNQLNTQPLSQNCDLSDLGLPLEPDELEDLLLQNFNDVLLPLESQMQFGDISISNEESQYQAACDLTAALLEDTKRPRDLNLSFVGETSTLSLPGSVENLETENINYMLNQMGNVSTLPGISSSFSQSRAASPTWSDSSGSVSTSSIKGTTIEQHSIPVPRHKRPSHKRAEIKRRDKIKTCLDDLKEHVPTLRDKGKLSETAILSKAAEYIHQLKDGCAERGCKSANLRREIQCLSEEIHLFQESLPASGLKEDTNSSPSLDDLHQKWMLERSHSSISTKFSIFTSITSKLFESFKKVVGSAKTVDSLNAQAQEWQSNYLSLPVLRKEILNGMLALSRQTNLLTFPDVTPKQDPDSIHKS